MWRIRNKQMGEMCGWREGHCLQPLLISLSALLIVLVATSSANGCECFEERTPTCAFYARADVVFIGTVANTSSNNTKGYPANTTQFRVDEAFKGLSNVTAEVDFPFPDCNVRPNVGEKYLAYA